MLPLEQFEPNAELAETRDSKAYYSRLLGLDKFPLSPEELPSSFHLPLGAIGDLPTGVAYTALTGKETGQAVSWVAKAANVNVGQYKKADMRIGNEDSVRVKHNWGTSLLKWHIHPTFLLVNSPSLVRSETDGQFMRGGPSAQDISILNRKFCMSLIAIDNDTILALARTEENNELKRDFDVIAIKEFLLEKNYHSGDKKRLATVLEALGIALYEFQTDDPQGLLNLDIYRNGLDFRRVRGNDQQEPDKFRSSYVELTQPELETDINLTRGRFIRELEIVVMKEKKQTFLIAVSASLIMSALSFLVDRDLGMIIAGFLAARSMSLFLRSMALTTRRLRKRKQNEQN